MLGKRTAGCPKRQGGEVSRIRCSRPRWGRGCYLHGWPRRGQLQIIRIHFNNGWTRIDTDGEGKNSRFSHGDAEARRMMGWDNPATERGNFGGKRAHIVKVDFNYI